MPILLSLLVFSSIIPSLSSDNFSSDSDTALATQQSIKAYVNSVAGSANNVTGLNATGAELNTVADFSAVSVDTSTAIANNDAILMFDNGNNIGYRDVDLLVTYMESTIDTLSSLTTTGALNSGSISSGFGNIDNGSSTITTTGAITGGSINGVGISYNISNFSESLLISNDAGTGTLSTATSNTGFGHEVFDDLTSGDNNTAIGHEAGDALTSGSLNTFVGSAAGGGNQSSSNNTAVGAFAFDAGTGADNVAIGSGALGGGSNSAADNVAIGLDAGNQISSGANNVLIGSHAGDALNTGQGNIAVGHNALTNEDGNSFNVAIGMNTLENLNAGADGYNTAVGTDAGNDLVSGLYNVLVGAFAGDALNGNGGGADQNVAIGNGALGADVEGNKSTAVGFPSLCNCFK